MSGATLPGFETAGLVASLECRVTWEVEQIRRYDNRADLKPVWEKRTRIVSRTAGDAATIEAALELVADLNGHPSTCNVRAKVRTVTPWADVPV